MKCVITCAGKGTRLLPFTKELPKEMAPVFINENSDLTLKPLLQLIFENMYSLGLREFCFVTGKTKRSIQNHFFPESNPSPNLSNFFQMITDSKLFWIDQLSPKGFGDAVYSSSPFVAEDKVIVHAGDVAFLPHHLSALKDLISMEDTDIDAAFLVREVKDPERHGIITTNSKGDVLTVNKVVEKPSSPESNLGIFPIYLFKNDIFDALNLTTPGYGGEIQLTDAIQQLISQGKNVVAIKISSEYVLDVGTPESYKDAIDLSYSFSRGPK